VRKDSFCAEPSADFVIKSYDEVEGFINAAGIRSPGFSSAPTIAHEIADILKASEVRQVRKRAWNLYRKGIEEFGESANQERDRLIMSNPLYAKMVCQCELVAEAEIVEAARRGATTLDGMKFRTRAIAGECQGSFCEFRTARILARELDIPVWKVTKNGSGSGIGIGDATVLLEEWKS
jgi:glycerol-3-phosphate dehydrogenase